MATQDEIDFALRELAEALWKAANVSDILAACKIEEGEDPSYHAKKATLYRIDADVIYPARPCHPFEEGSNVIPFIPRQVG